ncbi:hypothetical protein AS9A_0792 [Hoyosella subflava DQS3-9A1]|uniref:Peptidase C51 domain-containing protein n=1 Tax=Hoyosella subflava (strain DSM 45089 / JCM 17490 / NBRC 109087 / DQS3-9A1) TaxID=443218 RepID=F6EM38_HOYSD|nr:hypothetical protein AS9A_0792 [Hoyosella subflava DQS3-9A1]
MAEVGIDVAGSIPALATVGMFLCRGLGSDLYSHIRVVVAVSRMSQIL